MHDMNRVGDPKSLARKPRNTPEALGQVFTSPLIACKMVAGLRLGPKDKLLDPCVGPATFIKALAELEEVPQLSVDAFDIDPEMVSYTAGWASGKVKVSTFQGDYLQIPLDCSYDFAILNPPYVRQEWIELKQQYRSDFKKRYGLSVPGTANLYVYFILKVIADLKPGGRMSCIVYDSWQSTRYGKWLQSMLLNSCEDINIETVPGVPFSGRMIDATIIFATKKTSVEKKYSLPSLTPFSSFSQGVSGLSKIDDLFHTKRGLRLKQADFFLSKLDMSDLDGGQPFIKKIGGVHGYSIPDDHPESVLLLSKEQGDDRTLRELERRLLSAKSNPQDNVSILTWYKERPSVWAQHGAAPWAPILFNYYLRNRPRHVFNPTRIYADNFYGLTPRAGSSYAWLSALNSTLSAIGILESARNQGSGLAKLQLFEYRDSRVVDLSDWPVRDLERMEALGISLSIGGNAIEIIAEIDEIIASVLGDPRLSQSSLAEVFQEVDRRARRPK